MIKPIINEIFPSTRILIRNKYIDTFRRDYFINKIYSSGIKNIEIGSLNEHMFEGITSLQSINNKCIIYPIDTNNNVNDSINNFNKYRDSNQGVNTRILIQGNNYKEIPYIYFSTRPDSIEVSTINHLILNTVEKPYKIFLRPSTLKEVDKAFYENIYNYSSSILKCDEYINTIELINHLKGKLGVEIKVSMSSLKEVQKEIMDDFNW